MLIKNKTSFAKGMVMTAVFVAVLVVMFLPVFEGENAFRAADKLFNTISKGSTYYVPLLKEVVAPHKENQLDGVIKIQKEARDDVRTVLSKIGAEVTDDPDGLHVKLGFSTLFDAVLADVDDMFHNRGEAVSTRYGLPERQVLYAWWNGLRSVEKTLSAQKRFAEAKVMGEVLDRGVAVGYNYYEVEPQQAADRWGILTFSLVFYVVYTLWWGFAIYFLFEGFGLQLTAGKKKEV